MHGVQGAQSGGGGVSGEPVCISVALYGDDVELQVLRACVQLLEREYYDRNLTADERAAIAAYLAARYTEART
jgi:hypothetical protein